MTTAQIVLGVAGAAYILVAPFAAAFYFRTVGGLPKDTFDASREEAVMMTMLWWPVWLAIAVVIILTPKLDDLEKRGRK